MKKLTKVLLGVILSVAMVVAGGLAFSNLNNAYAKTSITIGGYGTIYATTSASSVDYGTYAQPNKGYVNGATVSTNKEFTGVKLTGNGSSKFNLGTIDISKSNWAGTATSVVEGNNSSFLEFVYQPSKKDGTLVRGTSYNEIGWVDFQLTDVNDPTNYLYLRAITYVSASDNYCGAPSVRAYASKAIKADGTTVEQGWGIYRADKTELPTSGFAHKSEIFADNAKKLGLGDKDLIITAHGAQTTPLALYFAGNAVYTSATTSAASKGVGIDVSHLVRDFDATTEKENLYSKHGAWGGFSSNMVNVTCSFGSLANGATSTSIVITKLGDYNFNNADINDGEANVVSGASSGEGSVKFGDYDQLTSGKTYSGINLTGGTGTTFDLGTMSINDTYFDKNWGYVKGLGAKSCVVDLSTENAGAYTNFNTAGKVSGAYYTGTDEAFTHGTADSRSFISFVINPSALSDYATSTQKEIFKVTLREVDNPDNFVTYHIELLHSNDSKAFELIIRCSATNNTAIRSERFYTDGITFDNTRRCIPCNGSQPQEVKLYYDFERQSAFTNVAYMNNTTADGIGAAFRIRDFDAIGKTPSDYKADALKTTGIKHWDGFSKDANVNISLEMMALTNSTVSTNSIVLTSLGGYDFSNTKLSTISELKCLTNATTDLSSVVCYQTNTVAYTANSPILDTLTYKVNGEVSAKQAVLNEGDVITVFDANNNKVGGDVKVTIVPLQKNIIPNHGTCAVYRENVLVEDDSIKEGDEIRFFPGNEEVSNLYLSDIRSFTIGETTYGYNETNRFNEAGSLIKVDKTGEKVNYYSYIVDGDSIVNGIKVVVSATFDRYCDITVTDSIEGTSKTTYHWAVDDKFDFPHKSAGNSDTIRRGASTDKVLMGYARTDVAKKKADGTFENIRSDYTVADYNSNNESLMYYANRGLGSSFYSNNEVKNSKSVVSIVPGITFEAVYVKMWIDVEIKLTSGYTDEYSGLRFVVKFDRADMDNYLQYFAKSEKKNNNPFNVVFNYVTTQDELDAGKKNVSYDKINSEHWLTNNVWDSASLPNDLGLYNGTGKTSAEMEGKPGYIFKQFGAGADIWHYEFDEEDDVYAYAITITGIDKNSHQDTEYIFMPLIRVVETCGSATSYVLQAKKATPSVVAGQKLTEVLKTEEFTGYNYKMVDQNGVTYYSNYTAADMNWLANLAKDGRTFTKVNA